MRIGTLRAGVVLALSLVIAGGSVTARPASAQAQHDLSNKKVTLNLENADIRYALKLLFGSAGVNYALDQAVRGVVTVSLTDVPFRTGLESILRSTQSQVPLTYRVEDGVYTISPKIDAAPTVDTGAPEPAVPEKPKTRFVKIPLNFADVYDIVQAFGGSVITSRMGQMTTGMGGMGGFGGGMGMGGMGMGGFGNSMGGFGGGLGNFGGGGGGFGGNLGGLGGFGNGGFGGNLGGAGNFGGGNLGGGNLGRGGSFGR